MHIIIKDKYASIRPLIDELAADDSYFASTPVLGEENGSLTADACLCIYAKRNKVWKVEKDGMTFIVKRYKRPSILQRIIYSTIRPTKARRAYLYAERLLQMGIYTPESVACVEKSESRLFATGFYVSTYCDWDDLRILNDDAEKAQEVIPHLVSFLADIHAKGFLHGDLNLSNIMYKEENGGYAFGVIDINRSHFVSNPSWKLCINNMRRLTHNKSLLSDIVRQYAIHRQWDTEKCEAYVQHKLRIFETRKNIISILKGKGKRY